MGGRSIGGMMRIPAQWDPVAPHWTVFFEVSDADATFTKAQALGGGARVPPADIPGVGRFAVVADSQGAAFAVVKLDPAFRA